MNRTGKFVVRAIVSVAASHGLSRADGSAKSSPHRIELEERGSDKKAFNRISLLAPEADRCASVVLEDAVSTRKVEVCREREVDGRSLYKFDLEETLDRQKQKWRVAVNLGEVGGDTLASFQRASGELVTWTFKLT